MTSIAQRKVILGKETAPGDGATPDVALRAIAALKATVDKRVPDEYVGSFAPQRHYIASKMAEGSLEFPDLYFEHAPFPVSMALGAGTVSGTVDPYTYTFTLAGTAGPPTFATYRLEYTDGGNHIVRADDVFATALEISGEAGGPLAINATIVGASVTYPAAVGATLSPLSAPTQALMAHTTLEIRDTYGFGTANVEQLISFNWKLENYMHQKQFAGSLYPTGRGNDKWKATLEIVAEMAHSIIETEKDKIFNTSQSGIQIKAAASANDSLTISGVYFIQNVDTLDERDGNNTVKITYLAEMGSSGDLPNIVCVTNLSGL